MGVNWNFVALRPRVVGVTLALAGVLAVLAVGSGAAYAQQEDEELAAKLEEMAGLAESIYNDYPDAVSGGAVTDQAAYDRALDSAHQMTAAFDAGEQDSDFEQRLQDISVVLGEQIEGQIFRLARFVEERRDPAEVMALLDELSPNFNRAVLLARGRVAPVDQRQLKTEQAVRDAVSEVVGLVEDAVAAYRQGRADEAAGTANEAFFTFESNGVGADVTILDEALENEVESGISSFANPEVEPGLEQLVASGAPLSEVEARAQEVVDGMGIIESLLLGTLPDVVRGDANGDGRVTITDALFVAQASVGLRTVDSTSADANGDGSVSIVDALLIAQAAIGLREL